MKDILITLALTVGVSSFVSISYNLYLLNERRCDLLSEAIKKEYRFGLLTGCMIKRDDEWVPMGAFRY